MLELRLLSNAQVSSRKLKQLTGNRGNLDKLMKGHCQPAAAAEKLERHMLTWTSLFCERFHNVEIFLSSHLTPLRQMKKTTFSRASLKILKMIRLTSFPSLCQLDAVNLQQSRFWNSHELARTFHKNSVISSAFKNIPNFFGQLTSLGQSEGTGSCLRPS